VLDRSVERLVHARDGKNIVDIPTLERYRVSGSEKVMRLEDSYIFSKLRGTEIGEVVNHDPRLTPKMLHLVLMGCGILIHLRYNMSFVPGNFGVLKREFSNKLTLMSIIVRERR
jgi:hypothetical protein